MLVRLAALLASLSLVSAQQSFSYQGFFPISSPKSGVDWVVGEDNVVAWEVGWNAFTDTLPPSFDVRLANPFSTHPPLFVATKVPLNDLSLAVNIDASVPTGDGYRLVFSDTYSGQIFAQSERFSVVSSGGNKATGLPTPKATATLFAVNDNPANYAATLPGKPLPTHTDNNNKVYYAASATSTLSRDWALPAVVVAVGAVAGGAWLF